MYLDVCRQVQLIGGVANFLDYCPRSVILRSKFLRACRKERRIDVVGANMYECPSEKSLFLRLQL